MHKKGAILVIQSWARRRLALQKVRFLRDIKLQDEAMQNAAIFCQVSFLFIFGEYLV